MLGIVVYWRRSNGVLFFFNCSLFYYSFFSVFLFVRTNCFAILTLNVEKTKQEGKKREKNIEIDSIVTKQLVCKSSETIVSNCVSGDAIAKNDAAFCMFLIILGLLR